MLYAFLFVSTTTGLVSWQIVLGAKLQERQLTPSLEDSMKSCALLHSQHVVTVPAAWLSEKLIQQC